MSQSQATLADPALDYLKRFKSIRKQTLNLVEPLETEDLVVQPVSDVSPPKWHLAHTTWFFEVFLLVPHLDGYELFHKDFPFLFNSYYVAAGDRWARASRGHLTRPTVEEVLTYRTHVEEHMERLLLQQPLRPELTHVIEIGLQHEQQHQELLLYDIKYILGHNPLFPPYKEEPTEGNDGSSPLEWLAVNKGNYHVGHQGEGFCFDNEQGRHEVHLEAYEIASRTVTNGEYLEFMQDGGYTNHQYWLSDGWDWLGHQAVKAPMYWINEGGHWLHYTLYGLKPIDLNAPVMHLSYYEANAYASWKGCRLPTEFEWEVAVGIHQPDIPENGNFVESGFLAPKAQSDPGFMGNLWEWTSSAYLPYPFYKAPDGALGEYNGKFMINQMVLRGGSFATPKAHIRATYRNFFAPQCQWLFSGLRLARHQ